MMLAYAAAQSAAPSHLVLYRVGEFYEVLGQNANLASRALGLKLTRRHQKDGADIPMCGVPASTFELAIARLLANGHKVAVSEQPVENGGERPLRRVSPATSVDVNVVPGKRTNNLTIALTEGQAVAFAWVDLSTGEASATTASLEGCGPALARSAPTEILVARWPDGSEALAIAVRSAGVPYSDLARVDGLIKEPGTLLEQGFGAGWQDRLRGFSPAELAAMAILLDYVHATSGDFQSSFQHLRTVMSDIVQVDVPTLRGLEVLTSASGRAGSLLSVIDRTVTSGGARLLARQLAAPVTSPQQIERRLAMVRFFVANPQIRSNC